MPETHWKRELDEKGWDKMLLSRLWAHSVLSVDQVSEMTGFSKKTVKRRFQKIVKLGKATWIKISTEIGECRIKSTPEFHREGCGLYDR